ncbi:MAG: DUF4920 domain-containing protein [Ignavibacteriales bacterium]|nr:MAG: DUF4920 domain-containing protein [Ignavibacteriales bacterium]
MKQIKAIILVLIISSTLIYAGDGKKYGKDISLTEKTKISEILSNPKEYVGKKVLVEGTIVDVCNKRGCWMELASDKEFEKVRIKVKDGEIVFPVEAKGSTALVEGEVYEINLTKEEALEHAEHIAEEQGKKFDPSTVTGPVTLYQIKGLGAEIK